MKSKFGTISIVLGIIGGLASLASALIGPKHREQVIRDQVSKDVARLLGK